VDSDSSCNTGQIIDDIKLATLWSKVQEILLTKPCKVFSVLAANTLAIMGLSALFDDTSTYTSERLVSQEKNYNTTVIVFEHPLVFNKGVCCMPAFMMTTLQYLIDY